MEFSIERGSPTASPRGGDGDSGAVAPPPPTEPSAQGGGAVESGAHGVTGIGGSSDQGAVVLPGGSGVIDGDQRRSGEEEERVVEGGNGGGEVVATPLDDLNIQWTTSTSGSSEEIAEGPPVGGDTSVVDDGGVGVPVTHPVEPSAQPLTTEEGRDIGTSTEEVVIAEQTKRSDEESGEAVGDRWRVWPRGGEDVVVAEWGSREMVGGSGSGGADGGGDDPKGKRVAIEELVREQGPVGISLGDYAVHPNPEDVAALDREAPGVLHAVREEVVGQRKREMTMLRQAALEMEAETEEWIQEAEEEEGELELRAWEELEVAQGPRVSVVE